MQRQGKIRRYDSKINAISRLVDSSIILLTFLALLDFFQASWQPIYIWALLFSIMSFNFFAESQDAYRSWRGGNLREEIEIVLFSWLTGAAFLVALDFFLINSQTYSDVFILAWIIVTPLELILWHSTVRMILAILRVKGYNTRSVAIIGATTLGQRLERIFSQMDWAGYNLFGFYDDRASNNSDKEKRVENIEIKGDFEQLISDCKQGKIDIVYITLAMSAEHRIKEMVEKLSDSTASVYLVPDLFVFNLLNSRWVDYQGITAISIYDSPFTGLDSFLKRMEDIVLSIVILLLVTPPMLCIALLIKITSKGPVLFKQARYGIDGEKIEVWKFRSMTVAENGQKVTQAVKGDSRITPLGAFLRKTSLDELPQFFNALGGSMSIVGPRPHAVAHNEEYRTKIKGYMLRHKVKPGITGLAQINGFRGETDTLDKMEGRIYYDLQYIQTWTLRLDLKIILLTVFKGFLDKNAY
ncbi:MAG: undecaprenyl-phosphate glucose phosphotransferase [Gammaproteobacteria bacterium]|nr:MAG: undecaprenyl-phosphate glucose phosphotransferase [Gammaproteobacteria bacterium]